jgi:outer membrane protein TolC
MRGWLWIVVGLAGLAVSSALTAAAAETAESDPLAGLRSPGGLTADEAARRASATSVDARVKARAAEAAEARQSGAEAGYWPRLTGVARYTRLSPLPPAELADPRVAIVGRIGGPGPVTAADALQAFTFPALIVPVNQYLTQASLTVPISDYVLRVSRSLAAASHSARAARIEEQAARLATAADARVGYYQWIRAQAQTLIATRALEQATNHQGDARHLFEGGLATRADILRADAQVKAAELVVVRAQNLAALAEERLRILMHDPGKDPYRIGEDILTAPTSDGGEPLASLFEEALANRLELRALGENTGAARALREAARAGEWPRFELFGDAVYANPNPRVFPAQEKFDRTWDVGAQLVWTPTDIPGARASGQERAAQENELRAQREALIDGLRLEVTEAWQAGREAAATVEKAAQELGAAEEGYRVRRDLFQHGRASLVELNDAQTELTHARLAVANAHVDARIARVRLAHAVGRDAR